MKKIYALMLLLLILSATAFGGISATVNAQRDQVQITEKVLYGDRSAADGLTVVNKNHYDDRLFWETAYTIGAAPVSETAYSFFATQKRESSPNTDIGVGLSTGINYGFDESLPASEQTGLSKAFKELFDATAAGEKKSKTVFLKNYYDYYPIAVSFGSNAVSENIREKFQEYFKIPVLASDKIKIHIQKNDKGSIEEYDSESDGLFELFSVSVVAPKRVRHFFTINNCKKSETSEYVDTGLIPGGYGIYSFSGPEDSLEMVYPLNRKVLVRELLINADETKLLLFTYEDGASYLTVIDIDTMQADRKIWIDNRFLNTVYQYEDFIVTDTDETLSVISCKDNTYTRMYTVHSANIINTEFRSLWDADHMDYQNGKLAVVGNTYTENFGYEACDFFVSVYDESGLIYYAVYDNGLDINQIIRSSHWVFSPYSYESNCHPDGNTISFRQKEQNE